MQSTVLFDHDLIKRYDVAGPRYTSYPTAVQFNESFDAHAYKIHAQQSNEEVIPADLSLYFHIPFCDTLCFYCACNKIVTNNKTKGEEYLQRLLKEVELQSTLFDKDRKVSQFHLGGGTPTFLSNEQILSILQKTEQYFSFAAPDQRDFSIEIDPRTVTPESVAELADIGFTRMSLGVQDFNIKVQNAVHRVQSLELTSTIIESIKSSSVKSLNIDLMYGLPFQTISSFEETLKSVIKLDPDKISLFNYAHLPTLFKPQRRIAEENLPTSREKLDILEYSINALTEAGYVYIGMDHFAKPNDELSLARTSGTLHRTFQGYSTHSQCDLVAFGITAIGQIGDCYSQNTKVLKDYYDAIDNNRIPILRGVELSEDDIIRKQVIDELMCYGRINISGIESQHNIRFYEYFQAEQRDLKRLEDDDLIEKNDASISIKPRGQLLIRNICAVFDYYLRTKNSQTHFSRVI